MGFISMYRRFCNSPMMMSGGVMSRFPFTATQWQELEHQALIYKYIISGIPVPGDLLFSLKTATCLVDSKFLSPQQQHVAWSCFQMGMGKKIDPEPGRCRRTDGKKWRCAKEAYPDSKYCERHMHRGKNRSRKHVESVLTSSPISPNPSSSSLKAAAAAAVAASSTNFSSLSASSDHLHHHNYQHQSSSNPSCYNYFLDPQINSDFRRNRYSYGLKEGVDEHAFFAEPSGTMRSFSASSMEDSWPLTRQSSSSSSRQSSDYSYLQLQSVGGDKEKQQRQQHFYEMSHVGTKIETAEPNKTIHRFFDEEPIRSRDSWDDNKSSNSSSVSTTKLSISIPSSSHDFPLFNSGRHHDG